MHPAQIIKGFVFERDVYHRETVQLREKFGALFPSAFIGV